MKKIISIVGARPNFIKLTALAPCLKRKFNHIVIHTGQHYDYDLSTQFFGDFKIDSPKYNLEVGSGSHANQTAAIMIAAEKTLIVEKPDLVVVYGDTNSTMAGALAAAKLQIPVAHAEAGDRCGNKDMPEEINRIVTDHLSALLFASSKNSLSNLRKENIKNAYFTGDLMLDATKSIKVSSDNILDFYELKPQEYIYATIHRAENTASIARIKKVLESLNLVGVKVILPLHPRTRKLLQKEKFTPKELINIHFTKPIPYPHSISLIKSAKVVVTDSGGVQKEAFWLRVPCITLRSEIEETEVIKSGWVKLVNPNTNADVLKRIIFTFNKPKKHPAIYGTGNAAKIITQKITEFLKNEK